jgi:hypothetical protein
MPIISVNISSTEKYWARGIQVSLEFNEGGSMADSLHS